GTVNSLSLPLVHNLGGEHRRVFASAKERKHPDSSTCETVSASDGDEEDDQQNKVGDVSKIGHWCGDYLSTIRYSIGALPVIPQMRRCNGSGCVWRKSTHVIPDRKYGNSGEFSHVGRII